jgi:hypothetical protein
MNHEIRMFVNHLYVLTFESSRVQSGEKFPRGGDARATLCDDASSVGLSQRSPLDVSKGNACGRERLPKH